MKRILLFLATVVLVSVITLVLKAQSSHQMDISYKPQPPKLYPVSLTIDEWSLKINYLEYVKNSLRKSDLPSKEVALITDSILIPFQATITSQVQAQLAKENAAQQKKDSIVKPKKH
jgi:hypothetical protein